MTGATSVASRIVVVGIGADGWAGLTDHARDELLGASVIYGSRRQLGLLGELPARRVPWESPMTDHLQRVLADADDVTIHVVASGDPMFHGVGSTIARMAGTARLTVIPTVSSASLACARLGWDITDVAIVSAVTAHAQVVSSVATHRRRVLVLSRDAATPSSVARILCDNGFGASEMTVLARLGSSGERSVSARADLWDDPGVDALNVIAVDCVGPRRSPAPGRPDDEFAHDGQITKSPIRALTVAALAPTCHDLLWDIGSGSGSVAIEWLRVAERTAAIAFEADAARAERITRNAARHGVAHRLRVAGRAPQSLAAAPTPDAVFIGGGLTAEVLTAAWDALAPGGRIVANAVTLETQSLLTGACSEHGGDLRRIAIETAAPLGSMTTWRPALPIVQWSADKPGAGVGTSTGALSSGAR